MTITISIAMTITMIMTTYLILKGFFTLIPQPFYVQGDLVLLEARHYTVCYLKGKSKNRE